MTDPDAAPRRRSYADLLCICPAGMPPESYLPGCPACEAFVERLNAIVRPVRHNCDTPGPG